MPEPENRLRKGGMWGCCYLCDLRQGWKVKVERSALWPHPISCPRCHQTWRDVAEFNAAAKDAVTQYMAHNWDTLPDNDVTPEDREWQRKMDDILDQRMRTLKKQNWSPYEHEEDKPQSIIVPDWKGDADDKGSVPATPSGQEEVRVDRGGNGSGGSGPCDRPARDHPAGN